MNKFAKMLMQDRRNPYGSKGGYVRDREDSYSRRDRRRDYDNDYDRRDRGDYGDYDRRDRDYDERRDYNDYYRRRDMDEDYRDRRDRDQDYRDRDRRDYGKPEMFSKRDMENWKSMMKNEDGTRGEHFTKEQVKRACEKAGIDCEEFGEEIFGLAMNMEYSDGQKVAKKYGVDIPEYYADRAKAFLRDKDFDGKPEEKLYLYYKTIVEKDD